MEEFVIGGPISIHKLSKSKIYLRQILQTRKSVPLLSLGLASSVITTQEKCMANARRVTYPYLLIIGEKDEIVNNKVTRAWFSKTSSKEKQIKLMVGAYHELAKEPNNHVMFESCLKFMADRIIASNKTFGDF